MKGSEFRKRYILLYSPKLPAVLPSLEKELYHTFRSKRKFFTGVYAIFLTNQFYKDQFINLVRTRYRDVETITTSGTIKKCKEAMKEHEKNLLRTEKEVSSLL